MATERLSMRHIREVLRQKWVPQRSATAAQLTWEQVEQLREEELEVKLYGPVVQPGAQRPLPDPAYIHNERKKAGVTLELLHLEYLEKHPDGYRYTQFCEYYRQWLGKHRLTMRQVHQAGEKLFVDYSGNKPRLVEAQTGERVEVELFVAVLGASNYTYAEATRTQRGPDFIASHQRCFVYLGGVPAVLVPDQLKSGVTRACRYEPGVQRTYEEFARHHGTVVLPARPRSPRDKAKVETGVLVVQRWLLARLRHHTFFTLEALNERIAELLEDLNGRKMRLYGASRRELFERLDKPALRTLRAEPFVYGEWKQVRVNIDYHVQVHHHFYSVPYTLVHQVLEARVTATTVELYQRGERVASHVRSDERGRHTTQAEHMPKAHQKHMEWTPSRLVHWAGTIGPHTSKLVESILNERPHPELGYRSCLGILRLARRYGNERLEAACARALAMSARSFRHLDSMLKNGLDRLPLPQSEAQPEPAAQEHENVRGSHYYH
jgi:transposase